MEPSKDVQVLIEHRNIKYKEIYAMEKKIRELKNEISATNKKIFSSCKHNWVRDWDAPFDSRCKRICSFCKLYANPHYNA